VIADAPVALYVHVPFCVSVCPYCDFVVYAGHDARGPRNRVAAYVGAVTTELDLRAHALDRRFGPSGTDGRPNLTSVYFGGGTPSLLPAETLATLLRIVRERFGLADGAEITLEANPGRDEHGDPFELRDVGVNRISFGVQSLDGAELKRLGRRHSPDDAVEAVSHARAARMDSVNIDLLYDVPGATMASWMTSLQAALALAPDHLSLYALTLDDPGSEGLTGEHGDHLPATTGARRWREAARGEQNDDVAAAQYEAAVALLAEAGFRGYEISNWARPGHESQHNMTYWERRPYEAVGPGAHAFDGAERRWNAARLDGYLRALVPPDGSVPVLPPGGQEQLDDATAAAEEAMLALRTDHGIAAAAAASPPLADVMAWGVDQALVERTSDQRLVLTTRGRLLSNEVFARLV
jgi:putative oxygen-independent coproporphyrinogen III oxidase